ncbi:MAG: UvrD-helicase domain-containing protein [Candidatus Hodarchaeota archaeon]
MLKNSKKPVLVIAGPGAGKTHDMVDRIMEAIPRLEPYRILAAITYTNAATANIKERLAKRISIPPNVFIGTNHSFCYRFIFKPFGGLVGKLPKELVFMDIDYGTKTKGMDHVRWIQKINSLKKNNLAKGRYDYDQILSLSAKILEDSKQVRTIVCNRLQYLFIDEFQDANNSQLKIFQKIMKGGKTDIYAVGDPEQYIFGWSSKIKSFDKIAINKFKDNAKVETNDKNQRSCDEIVRFINQFHCEIDQVSEKGSDTRGGVYFISGTDLDNIIRSYRDITKILEGRNLSVVKYYLSYANKTLEKVAGKWGLIPVSNESTKALRLIDESLKVISSVIGINGKQICEIYKLDRIGLRKKGLHLLKAIREGKIRNGEDVEVFIKNNLRLRVSRGLPRNKVEDKLKRMSCYESIDDTICERDMYSTIHKAKGLQADAVLVVAENKGQLEKWLMTDKKARCKEKTDRCRIGYVAFSRAKTILCIACLGKIDKSLEQKLERLGVSKK